MKIPNWYVITGGPSSGKAILLEKLQKLGYYTVLEAASMLIDKYAAKGVSAQELRKNECLFQKEVLQMKLEIEETTPKNKTVFFDRGIPDSITYYQSCGLDAKEVESVSKNRYRKIFFLEQLPFKRDDARAEDEESIRELDQSLPETYKKLGYEVVFIPAMKVEERLKLILTHL